MHTENATHSPAPSPVRSRHAPDGQPCPVFILTERPDVAAERIARKRWVYAALRSRGEAKHDYIAAVLGVSRQRVSRCLSEAHRDEFSVTQLERLGLAEVRAA